MQTVIWSRYGRWVDVSNERSWGLLVTARILRRVKSSVRSLESQVASELQSGPRQNRHRLAAFDISNSAANTANIVSHQQQVQVTWPVVSEVRSKSFWLVTDHHKIGRAIATCRQSYFSSSSVVSCAFYALCVYSTFGYHPHLLGYLCAKFCFFRSPHCWASPWRKIAYSINQTFSQTLTHPAYLMPREPKLSLWNNCSCQHII